MYGKDGWGPWVEWSGGSCPCVGDYVHIVFYDGDEEYGTAIDHVYWYYVSRYRVRRPKGLTILQNMLKDMDTVKDGQLEVV